MRQIIAVVQIWQTLGCSTAPFILRNQTLSNRWASFIMRPKHLMYWRDWTPIPSTGRESEGPVLEYFSRLSPVTSPGEQVTYNQTPVSTKITQRMSFSRIVCRQLVHVVSLRSANHTSMGGEFFKVEIQYEGTFFSLFCVMVEIDRRVV